MMLSQFGLTAELFDEPLVPIGTVYDPFIARGLDALVYALYIGARFILAATPSGVTLAPEGGAHQSTITPSMGIELPSLHATSRPSPRRSPGAWRRAIRGVLAANGGLLHVPAADDPRPWTRRSPQPVRDRLGEAEWRRQTLAGGYRLLESGRGRTGAARGRPRASPSWPSGAIVPEAVAAVRSSQREEVAADLVVVTSADRLAAEIDGRRLTGVRDRSGGDLDHLATLAAARCPPRADGHGPRRRVARAGLPRVGRSGRRSCRSAWTRSGSRARIADLYADAGIDADHIIEAALLAIELGDQP